MTFIIWGVSAVMTVKPGAGWWLFQVGACGKRGTWQRTSSLLQRPPGGYSGQGREGRGAHREGHSSISGWAAFPFSRTEWQRVRRMERRRCAGRRGRDRAL